MAPLDTGSYGAFVEWLDYVNSDIIGQSSSTITILPETAPIVNYQSTALEYPIITGFANVQAGDVLTFTMNGSVYGSVLDPVVLTVGNNQPWLYDTSLFDAASGPDEPLSINGGYPITATLTRGASSDSSTTVITFTGQTINNTGDQLSINSQYISVGEYPVFTGTAPVIQGATFSVYTAVPDLDAVSWEPTIDPVTNTWVVNAKQDVPASSGYIGAVPYPGNFTTDSNLFESGTGVGLGYKSGTLAARYPITTYDYNLGNFTVDPVDGVIINLGQTEEFTPGGELYPPLAVGESLTATLTYDIGAGPVTHTWSDIPVVGNRWEIDLRDIPLATRSSIIIGNGLDISVFTVDESDNEIRSARALVLTPFPKANQENPSPALVFPETIDSNATYQTTHPYPVLGGYADVNYSGEYQNNMFDVTFRGATYQVLVNQGGSWTLNTGSATPISGTYSPLEGIGSHDVVLTLTSRYTTVNPEIVTESIEFLQD
jgi:hypothetical protein